VVGLLTLMGLLASPARAAELDKVAGSLRWVPADASFYHVSLRNKEQLDLFLKSRAFAKLAALPLVQEAVKEIKKATEKDGPLEDLRKFYEDFENKDLIALIGDALSNEIFCHGGAGWADLLDLILQFNRANQLAQMEALLKGEIVDDEQQLKAVCKTLARNTDKLHVPDLVIGFKISDAKKARVEIKRLETLVMPLVQSVPELKGKLRRVKIGEDSFLTLTLDGKMIDWEQVPFKDAEDKPGEFNALKRKLTAMKLTISLGVRDDYLLLYVGESSDTLQRLLTRAEGKRLADRPEFKPLEKFADKRLTSISYASQAMRAKLTQSNFDPEGLVEVARLAVEKADLPAEKKKQLQTDIKAMAADMKQTGGDVGAALGFSFLTDRGMERFDYDWSKYPGVDGSKPLTLLNHLGETPVYAAVTRLKIDPLRYQTLVKWIKTAHGHFEDLVVPKFEGETKENYEKISKEIFPLLKRLDVTTVKLLLPAIADGQFGFVVDSKWESKQWISHLPETEKPLPMFEVGLILGISDAEKFQKAMAEYRTILNELLDKIKLFAPPGEEVPDIKIPKPHAEKFRNGTLYFFAFPKEWGLDGNVVPVGGLSDTVAVLAFSQGHTERLLTSRPLKTDGAPLADRKRPLVSATRCDWAALIDTLAPWVELGIASIPDDDFVYPIEGDFAEGKKAKEETLKVARVVMEVLKCLRGWTSATYLEDGVTITHVETVYKDLEK
jgi:hypothetical protein